MSSSFSSAYYHYKEPVLDWSAFYLVTAVTSYLGAILLALAVASGLFYLAELAEEYSVLTRKVLRVGVVVVTLVHIVIALVDQISLWRSLVSVIAQFSYFQLLHAFPWVVLSSPVAISAMVCFVLDNAAWYSYFLGLSSEFPFWSIVSFFVLCVWAVPVGFFISLAIAEDRTPGIGTVSGRGGLGGDLGGTGKKRKTLASLLGVLTGKREDF